MHVVVDLTHDLGRSFEGGNINVDRSTGQVKLQGAFLQVRSSTTEVTSHTHEKATLHSQSYGTDNYTAFGCYDFLPPSSVNEQAIITSGTFQPSPSSSTTITINPN